MTKRITILGAGESGIGSAILAKKLGYNVFVSDKGSISKEYKNELLELELDFEENQHSDFQILESEIIVKSPGIPENVAIVQKAKEKGIEIISEPEFASRHYNGEIIAITGTNGKTTTTLLTYHLLKEAGLNVGLAGNVGISFARQVATEVFDIYVLEISSFQLDGVVDFKPNIAVLLNITPDHLDRYDGVLQNYINSKFRLIKNLDRASHFIYNFDDDIIKSNYKEGQQFFNWPISLKEDNKAAFIVNEKKIGFDCHGGYHLDLRESPLIGKHNVYNTMAAFIAARLCGLNWEVIERGLKSFKNAEHRLEEVAVIDGIKFINDSKATNVDSTFYALEGLSAPIIWIAGGVDKGNDYKVLKPFTEKVKALLCLGLKNSKLKTAFKSKIDKIEEFDNVNKVVKRAYKMAKNGDTVLLSPACASFDLFKNYIDRGDQFKKAVHELRKKELSAK
ncbi:UDP-N-acetylmuramoyl-L-alanine--D-glutamate ligase [Hyphobacterium sp. CCMP332]|nr:UDP-N-acetylmuramoyl-L-alanine--D-glutamate ligase [Hyphobacterium sp. CCMP332]